MIPNHKQLIEAIHAKHKVCVRFYSLADSEVVDRVCAPMDYGPGKSEDGLNRYWFWNYASNAEPRLFGLTPQQVIDLRVLGEPFDPAPLDTGFPWGIPREWGSLPPAQAAAKP